MSRVLTFSRVFPSYHPRKGEPTCFVEKIYNGLKIDFHNRNWIGLLNDLNNKEMPTLQMLAGFVFGGIDYKEEGIKHHTIRAGNRFKVGDKFSPRVWSDKPYRSKQIIIAPDIEVKNVWGFEVNEEGFFYINKKWVDVTSTDIPKNDGLNCDDFLNWFPPQDFVGQIICWNENIEY